jgi:hypothetical protein
LASSLGIQIILATDSVQERRLKENANFQLLAALAGAPGDVGSVSSVAIDAPSSIFAVAGSPITDAGTISLSFASQAQGAVFAGPAGGSGTPLFRALVGADLPVFGPSGSGHGPGAVPDPGASAGTSRYLREDGTWVALSGGGGGTGSVTSVGLSMPGQFSVSNSPVTVSGNLSASWVNQAANQFFAGPAGGSATTPGFRALVGADLPVFGPSGSGHAPGGVPDPGVTAGALRYLREDGTWNAPGVTSVGLSLPTIFNVSGSPVTGSGILAATLANQSANQVLAGPEAGAAASPAFRALAAADLPVFMGSGSGHSAGGVPDPGATAGSTRYLREDGTWAVTISNLNGVTAASQTFGAIGTTGSGPNWASAGSVHTLNLPYASPTVPGLLSTAAQTIGGAKTFSAPIAASLQYLTTALVSKTSSYSILNTDCVIIAPNNGTMTLPTAVGIAGQHFTIKKGTTSSTITVATTGSQQIDGAASYSLTTAYQYVTVVSDGANWWVVASGT